MPRMFDILRGKSEEPEPENSKDKKHPENKEKKKESAREDSHREINFPKQIHQISKEQKSKPESLEVPEKIIEAVKKKNIDSVEIAKEKYDKAVEVAKVVLRKVDEKESIEFCADEIYYVVDEFTDQLLLGNQLLEYMIDQGKKEDYLPFHIVNVCILSLAIGTQMKLNKSRLHILGMAAFLYDLGLVGLRSILDQPRDLTEEEIQEVRKHVAKSAEIASKIHNRYHDVVEVIEQHHERVSGAGYPKGLKQGQLNEYARIIGLVDTYEAMTHWRPYRPTKIPHEAIKEIVGLFKIHFDPQVIKALIDKISIYPVGSFVRLSNGDVAKVINAHSDSPLRPLVLVMFDARQNPYPEPKSLDLSKNTSIYIKDPVSLSNG